MHLWMLSFDIYLQQSLLGHNLLPFWLPHSWEAAHWHPRSSAKMNTCQLANLNWLVGTDVAIASTFVGIGMTCFLTAATADMCSWFFSWMAVFVVLCQRLIRRYSQLSSGRQWPALSLVSEENESAAVDRDSNPAGRSGQSVTTFGEPTSLDSAGRVRIHDVLRSNEFE